MSYIPLDATKAHQYDDILHMEHHVSDHHVHMSRLDRAAQFSPFAALTGYDAAISETGRLTEDKVFLSDARLDALEEHLQYLAAHIAQQPELEITYFLPDEKKEGGAYKTCIDTAKKIDNYKKILVLKSGLQIAFEDLYRLDGPFFAPLREQY